MDKPCRFEDPRVDARSSRAISSMKKRGRGKLSQFNSQLGVPLFVLPLFTHRLEANAVDADHANHAT